MAEKQPFMTGAEARSYYGDFQRFFQELNERRGHLDKIARDNEAKKLEFGEVQKKSFGDFAAGLDEIIAKEREALTRLAPIDPDEPARVPLNRMAYSDRMAAIMAKLSLLSYIAFETPGGRESLAMLLARANMTLIECIFTDETECFVVKVEGFVVAAFRGTTSKKDAKTDWLFNLKQATVDGHKRDVHLHCGFHDAFNAVKDQLHKALSSTPNHLPIFLTGHSLGGALALVASAVFSGADALGPRIGAVYTFGSPRVGDESFNLVVKAPHYRVINQYDLVPHAPPSWLYGYRHTGDALLLKRNKPHPERKRPWGSVLILGLFSLVLAPFSRRLLADRVHDIGLYAARLQAIAEWRGSWS